MTQEKLQILKEDFYTDWSASEDVRDRANEEYRFVTVDGGHWEGFLTDAYENRAKLQMDHTSEYVDRTLAQWTQNRQQPNYQPSDEATSDEDADLLDGLYRRDVQRFGGQSAIDTAVKEAMKCGFGALVLNVQYEDEGDSENENQNVTFTEHPNAYSTVVFDSGARTAEKSDATHVTILTPYSKKAFEKNWPDKVADSLEVKDQSYFNWSTNELIYVATTYKQKTKTIRLQTGTPPESGEIVKVDHADLDGDASELEMAGFVFGRERKIKKNYVEKTVWSGSDILEPARKVVGEHLPVIPFYANRDWVDGQEQFSGIVRKRMDTQRVLNMSFSLAAESAAHASDSKPVFAPEQMTNPTVRASWQKNWHQSPYVLAAPIKDANGTPVHLGPTAMMPGTSISPAAGALIQMCSESIERGTGGAPQDMADPNASGKAINALIKRIDLNTAVVFDNIHKAIKQIGVVYESIAREVYSANENRHIKIVSDRGESRSVKLNQQQGFGGKLTSINNLSKGRFEVIVDISKDYQTAKEETFDALKDIVQLFPEGSARRAQLADSLILMKDSKGMEDMQDYIRKEMLASGVVKAENEDEEKYLQQLQESKSNDVDPNEQLMAAAAAEQQSQAKLNEAKIADTQASAAKKAVEAEKTTVETMGLAKELGLQRAQ
jgi:hypothetical protein